MLLTVGQRECIKSFANNELKLVLTEELWKLMKIAREAEEKTLDTRVQDQVL
jgi:hypothetical protein